MTRRNEDGTDAKRETERRRNAVGMRRADSFHLITILDSQLRLPLCLFATNWRRCHYHVGMRLWSRLLGSFEL